MYKNSVPSGSVTGNDRYEGYLADLTRLLSMIVGFEYELRMVKDLQYGMENPDGTWNGMIGELMRGVCDQRRSYLFIIHRFHNVADLFIVYTVCFPVWVQ